MKETTFKTNRCEIHVKHENDKIKIIAIKYTDPNDKTKNLWIEEWLTDGIDAVEFINVINEITERLNDKAA